MSKPSVAVFGLNGSLGAATLAAFSSPVFKDKFQFPILAVTRDTSKTQDTEYVKYIQGNVSGSVEDLAAKLKGTNVVVSLVGPSPDTFSGLETLLGQVKPKLYIPSQFGVDIHSASKVFPGFLQIKTQHSINVRELGIKVVEISTSLFVGGIWLYELIGHIGADTESKSVTYLGGPDQKFNFSRLEDIGRVVASVSYKAFADLDSFPDHINVSSGTLTAKDVVERYEATHNVKLSVKETVPKEQVLKEANAIWAGGLNPSKFLYYLNVLVSQGEGNGVSFGQTDNELVNPGESLWTWEKY